MARTMVPTSGSPRRSGLMLQFVSRFHGGPGWDARGQQDSRREQRVGRGLLVSGRSLSFLRDPSGLGPTSDSLLLSDKLISFSTFSFHSKFVHAFFSAFYIRAFHVPSLSYEIFCIRLKIDESYMHLYKNLI